MHDGEHEEVGIRQRIPEWRRRLQRPCQGREEGREVERIKMWECRSGLRPSAEKNGGLTAVLLYAHKRSVTCIIAKEKSKVSLLTKRASASILHSKSMQNVASSDHNVERGDSEPRDNECVSDLKVTADTLQTDICPRAVQGAVDTGRSRPGHPLIVLWSIVTSSELRFLFCLVQGLIRSNCLPGRLKRVRTDHTSLMGPARWLLFPTRFQWRPNGRT